MAEIRSNNNTLRKKRVLVVDDHEMVLDAVAKILKKENIYEIAVAKKCHRSLIRSF